MSVKKTWYLVDEYYTRVTVVPGGLLFKTHSGSSDGGVAMAFVPTAHEQAEIYVEGLRVVEWDTK